LKTPILLVLLLAGFPQFAESQSNKKVQEIDFDGANVDGKVRNPDGSFLVQKRGIDFVPLYKVKEHFDKSIKESVEYLR
jgi:hypothetical protein